MTGDSPDIHPFIRSGYDALGAHYVCTFANELDHKPLDRELLSRFAELAGGDAHVADIGCGPGHIGRSLLPHGLRVTGFDLSLVLMREGRAAATRAGADPAALRYVQADMAALPIRAASLGGLIAFYSIIHLHRAGVPRALAEFRRALKRGAPLLLAVHVGQGEIITGSMLDRGVRMFATLFTKEEMDSLLAEAGFTSRQLVQRDPYPVETSTQRLYALARRSD
jgi:SAM-dependent methyltransferase